METAESINIKTPSGKTNNKNQQITYSTEITSHSISEGFWVIQFNIPVTKVSVWDHAAADDRPVESDVVVEQFASRHCCV